MIVFANVYSASLIQKKRFRDILGMVLQLSNIRATVWPRG